MILIYSFETCTQCMSTYTDLFRKGVPEEMIEVLDLAEHPEMLEKFKAQNLLSAPIVVSEVGIWSGFRPDLIDGFVERLNEKGVALNTVSLTEARELAKTLKERAFSLEKVAA